MSTQITPGQTERASGRHPINVGHLVMGIAFLGVVGIWSVLQADIVDSGDIRWLLPVPWVLAGGGGLLAIALSSRRRWSYRGPMERPYDDEIADPAHADRPGTPDFTDTDLSGESAGTDTDLSGESAGTDTEEIR